MHSPRLGLLALFLVIPLRLPAQTAADTSAILEHLSPQLLLDRAEPGSHGHLAVLHLPAELEYVRHGITARLGPLCMSGAPEDSTSMTTQVWVGLHITRDAADLYVHHVVPPGSYSLGYGFVRDSAGAWTRVRLSSGIGDGFGGTSLTDPRPAGCVGGLFP